MAFQILLVANIIFLLAVLYLIFHEEMFDLWAFQLAMATFMAIIAFVEIGLGESQKWFWLPGIWLLGLVIPCAAGFMVLIYFHIRNKGKKKNIYC
jgi:hypothetical protein